MSCTATFIVGAVGLACGLAAVTAALLARRRT